jgi:hypothetical protein
LKAMCSKKWATPLFFWVSEAEPASIQIYIGYELISSVIEKLESAWGTVVAIMSRKTNSSPIEETIELKIQIKG